MHICIFISILNHLLLFYFLFDLYWATRMHAYVKLNVIKVYKINAGHS